MWPTAASVTEARKRAEEQEAREAAARAEREAKEAAEQARREAEEAAERARREAEEAAARAEEERREAEKAAKQAEEERRKAERIERIQREAAELERTQREAADDDADEYASLSPLAVPSPLDPRRTPQTTVSQAKTKKPLDPEELALSKSKTAEIDLSGTADTPDASDAADTTDVPRTEEADTPHDDAPLEATSAEPKSPYPKDEDAKASDAEPVDAVASETKPAADKTADAQDAAIDKSSENKGRHSASGAHGRETVSEAEARSKRKRTIAIISGLCAAAIVCIAVALFMVFTPITTTVNGTSVELKEQKTLGAAIEAAGLTPTAGNLIAVDGSVLEEGGGDAFSATIDGNQTTDPNQTLTNGAVVEISDGNDVKESSTLTTESAPFTAVEEGKGAIHTIQGEGVNGTQDVETGEISGLQAVTVTEEPTNITCVHYNANVGDEKVIALTFDDGPNNDYTPQVLDVLKNNGAHATFFTLGYRITGNCVDVVKRAADEGHQICTHSWDHAEGSGQGVNLSYMTPEEQVAEIQKGYEAIETTLGTEASHIIRTPGGNFPPTVIANLSPYITSEIGWNIDTNDWQRPGVAAIKASLLSASPGDIILMHDGGGDRSQTVQALSEALPQLADQGYRFVTIDELLALSNEGN